MLRYLFVIILFILNFRYEVRCARILCIIPTPSISHQVVLRSLVEGLASRGHELVVGSTDPSTEKVKNIEEIDFRFAYKLWDEHLNFNTIDGGAFSTIIKFANGLNAIIEKEISHPRINEIMNNPNEKFDLVIVEYIAFPLTYALSIKFNAPLIGVLSMDANVVGHDEMGNFPQHSMFPDAHFTPFVGQLSIFQRLESIIQSIVYRCIYYGVLVRRQDELVKKFIGSGYPSGSDVYKYVDLLFVNAHPAIGFGRPVVPRMIDISGIHVKPPKHLQNDLEDFVNNAPNGVVVFSLGTNVKSDRLSSNMISNLLEAFSGLPYRVVWKWESSNMTNIPANVRLLQWIPQNDLLAHKNVKLFIFQCGYQSLIESITYGVPMVGIPFVGDQLMNANKIVYYKLGVRLNHEDITKSSVKKAINDVIGNIQFKENVMKMSRQLWDSPQSPLERAVWWTEYVLRHNGTRHLRAPVQHLPFYQLLYLDIMAFLLTVFFIFSLLVYFVLKALKYASRKIFSIFTLKVKSD